MKVTYLPAVIASSGTTSAAVSVGNDAEAGGGVVAIFIPASFEGTAITFLGSMDNSTFKAVNSTAGTAVSYTVVADTWVSVPVADLAGYAYIKIVSGTSVAASRTLYVAVRKVA